MSDTSNQGVDTNSAVAAPLPSATTQQPAANNPQQPMNYADVENVWIQAGGNPQAAAMAAAVADAESGLNPGASRTNPDGTVSIGLWLIPQNGMPPGSTDPVANARAAVQLSQNGQDWKQWCSTWSDNNCGLNDGKYLGEGSNALGSLAQKLTPSSYNVVGSAPSGNGTGASSATQPASTPGTGTTTETKHSFIWLAVLALVIVAIFLIARRRAGRQVAPAEKPPEANT